MIQQYLENLGFNEKEVQLYTTLVEIGIQPASVVANRVKMDRVTAYKNLKKLADKGYLKVYFKDTIQCFGVDNFEQLLQKVKEQEAKYHELADGFPMVENLLKSLQGSEGLVPKLQIFEGEAGIKSFFRDLYYEVKSENVHQIRMITSNTFEERLGDVPLSKYVQDFYEDIKREKIDLEIYEASGTLIPERLRKVPAQDFDPSKLPAARGTTNIFIAGHAVYLACYKTSQIGLKIKQAEMSQMFHFLFDFVGQNI